MSEFIPYQTMECLHTIEDPGEVSRVAITPDGQFFASSSKFPVKVWNSRTGKVLHDNLCPDELARSLAISADGQLLAAGCDKRTTTVWNLHTGEKLHQLYVCTEFPCEVSSVAFTPDGNTLLSAWGGNIDLWNLPTGKLRFPGMIGASYLALSPNGEFLVGNHLSTVEVSHFPSQRLLHRLDRPLNYVSCIAISADGQSFAVGNRDGIIKLFDTTTATEKLTFTSHADRVKFLIFSPDGQTIISCGYDKLINFWNFHTGEKIHTLEGHPREVDSMALSADGRTLVSCNGRPSLAKDQFSIIKVWGIR